eukprot:460811-Pyramimonas_sp.AAC.1
MIQKGSRDGGRRRLRAQSVVAVRSLFSDAALVISRGESITCCSRAFHEMQMLQARAQSSGLA